MPTVTLPVSRTEGTITIDWGDGTTEYYTQEQIASTNQVSHEYAVDGQYTVRIHGPLAEFGTDPSASLSEPGASPVTYPATSVSNFGENDFLERFCFAGASETLESLPSVLPYHITSLRGALHNYKGSFAQVAEWDVSAVTDLSHAFNGSIGATGIDNWNVSNVADFSYAFMGATGLNVNLAGWDVSSGENFKSMFDSSDFNSPIPLWDVGLAYDMTGMFANSPFNQNISGWNVAGVMNFDSTFMFASAFNQDLSSWVTSAAITMNNMFQGALAFNQDVSGWDVANVTSMDYMFDGNRVLVADLSSWCVANVPERPVAFADNPEIIEPIWGTCPGDEPPYMEFVVDMALQEDVEPPPPPEEA